jgi:hypothetical protein
MRVDMTVTFPPLARKAAWPIAVVAAVLVVFSPALGGDRTLARKDSARMVGPLRTLVSEALRRGRLPLWNPHEAAGMPLFADGVHSVLHPVSVAGALIAPRSVDFLLVGYLLVAALGAYALARVLGASPVASAAAGVAYATCGFTVSMTGAPAFLAGAGALAWMLAAARYCGEGGRWGAVACALSTAVGFAAGDAQSVILGGAVGAALAWDAGGGRSIPRVAGGMAVGALLAGVQVAATWRLLPETMRGYELLGWERVQWALHPVRLVEWLVPGFARGPLSASVAPDLLGGPAISGPFADSVYLGAPVLLLAAVGIGGASRRTRSVLVALLLVLLWIALGHHLGARWALDFIPVWNRFRYTEKLMAPLSLLCCAGAALGIDRLVTSRLGRPVVVAAEAIGLAAICALAGILAAPDASRALLALAWVQGADFLLANLRTGLLHAALGAGALLLIDQRRLVAPRPAAALLLAASTAAAVPFGAHFGVASVQAAREELPLEAAAPGPRLAHPVQPEVPPAVDGALDAADSQIRAERTELWPSWNVASGIDAITAYSGLQPLRLNALETALGAGWWAFSRRFGVTHVVVGWRFRPADVQATLLAVAGGNCVHRQAEPPLEVWAVPHAPWAAFATRARAVQTPGDAFNEVTRPARPDDLGAVVVEAEADPPTAPGRVLAVSRGSEEVRVEAESAGEALLVVRDAFWPGWKAWMDDVEVPILAADLLVRAVQFPPGRHVLVMRYEPPEIRFGWALSGLGLVALGALVFLESRRRGARWRAGETEKLKEP